MFLWFLIQSTFAETIAIYTNEDAFNSEKQPLFEKNTERILWQDVQKSPLSFYGVEPQGGCISVGKKNSEIQISLDKIVSLLNYVELEKALGHINRIENDFLCLQEIVPAEILSRSYYLSGITYHYMEDSEQATENWKQSLTFYPEAQWDDNIEPSGKPLFEQLQQDIETTASAQLSLYPSSAKITVDGITIENGANIPAGRQI